MLNCLKLYLLWVVGGGLSQQHPDIPLVGGTVGSAVLPIYTRLQDIPHTHIHTQRTSRREKRQTHTQKGAHREREHTHTTNDVSVFGHGYVFTNYTLYICMYEL